MKTPAAQPSVAAGGGQHIGIKLRGWPQSIFATKSAQSGHSLKKIDVRRRYVLESDIAHRGRD
jgi:hypothetical protein